MVSVVIPMAGAGSRFSVAGYDKPKPFIDILGKPMISRVIENLYHKDAKYILVARREHLLSQHSVVDELMRTCSVDIVPVDGLTEGTACTVLFARHLISNDQPIVIANSDQIVDFDFSAFVGDCLNRGLDGSILTFNDNDRDPKWSFAKLGSKNLVEEVKEKEAISNNATAGIYLFRRGIDFVDAAIDMILAQDRVNGEYYTCPVYNYLIARGRKIGIYPVDASCMHGVGTPSDLQAYLAGANIGE